MVVTSDENGKVLSREPVPEELIGEFYRNLISEDFVDENWERVVTIETLNDRGEVISKQSFRPTIMQVLGEDYFDETVLETINEKGDKVVYFFDKKLSG